MGLGREAEALEFGAKLNAIKAERGQRPSYAGNYRAPPPETERPPPLGWGSLTTPPLMPKVTLPSTASQLLLLHFSLLRFEPSTSSTQIPHLSSSPAAVGAAGAGEGRDEVEGGTKPVLVLRGFVLRKEGGSC